MGLEQLWRNAVLLSGFQHELNCLMKHVDNKCLENIPPGFGTSRNERLHRTLNNSPANVPCIGPQLMDTLLTLIFYAWNRRRSGNPVLPVDRLRTSEGKWGFQFRFRLHQWCLQKKKNNNQNIKQRKRVRHKHCRVLMMTSRWQVYSE